MKGNLIGIKTKLDYFDDFNPNYVFPIINDKPKRKKPR